MNDKDRMKKLSMMTNEEIEKEAKELMNDGIPKELIKPLWEDEMLKEQIANTTDEVRETFRKSWNEIMEKMHVKNSPRASTYERKL